MKKLKKLFVSIMMVCMLLTATTVSNEGIATIGEEVEYDISEGV